MDDDKIALVEKIVKDIQNVLSKSAELHAFDIVPVDSNMKNKSPVLYIENCLGLESWCVKFVFMHCYSEIMDNYCNKFQKKNKKVITADADRLIKLLNVSLLINPELSSLWNKRREMVQNLLLNRVSELHFAKLVLSRKPKCNDVFSYRRWILNTILMDEDIPLNVLQNLVEGELGICDQTADKSPNNYHSWSHRLWFLNRIKQTVGHFDMDSLYIKEYNYSEKWISKHVSDYSCFHFRQHCIKNVYSLGSSSWKLFENSCDVNLRKALIRVLVNNFPKDLNIQVSEDNLLSHSEENLIKLLLSHNLSNCKCNSDSIALCRKLEILCHELLLNNELIMFYNSHETLWYHRRFVIHELMAMLYEYYNLFRHNGILVKRSCKSCGLNDMRQKQAKISRFDGNCIYKSALFQIIFTHENNFIQNRLNDGDNYAGRHEKYLKFVEGLNNVM